VEQVITKMVQDFENGNIGRRQFIQGLAMAVATAAAGSTVGSAQAAAPPGNRVIKAVALNHVSYLADDYKKTVAWYEDLFGMQRYHETGTSCNLAFGGPLGPYMVIRDINHATPENFLQKNSSNYIDHVAYEIESWDAHSVEADLKRRGLDPRPSGNPPTSFLLKDLNGFGVQVTSGKEVSSSSRQLLYQK
jgi:catechol 2,3-dioxygenase-like lactoylglutathione lyase family enzyme